MEDLLAHRTDEILMSGQLGRYDGELGPLITVEEIEDRVHLVIDGR